MLGRSASLAYSARAAMGVAANLPAHDLREVRVRDATAATMGMGMRCGQHDDDDNDDKEQFPEEDSKDTDNGGRGSEGGIQWQRRRGWETQEGQVLTVALLHNFIVTCTRIPSTSIHVSGDNSMVPTKHIFPCKNVQIPMRMLI